MVRAPTIARRFVENGSIDPEVTGDSQPQEQPPLAAYVLSAACDLSELLYTVMVHNDLHGARLGDDYDISQRMQYYHELVQLTRGLSPLIQADGNNSLETCYLR